MGSRVGPIRRRSVTITVLVLHYTLRYLQNLFNTTKTGNDRRIGRLTALITDIYIYI
jgi:hypothetical protein